MFYVYAWYDRKGVVIYVGSGSGNRWYKIHKNSLIASSLVARSKKLLVTNDRDFMLEYERALIFFIQPRCNVKSTGMGLF